jgi:hypothetical protein
VDAISWWVLDGTGLVGTKGRSRFCRGAEEIGGLFMAVSTGPGAFGGRRQGVVRAARLLGAFVGVAASLAAVAGPANAAVGNTTCTGTLGSPGTLSGVYSSNVTVNGVCGVDAGPATLQRNLTITPGSALVAAFGLNDQTGSGNSNLTVEGNLVVQTGAALIMGCEPNFFPCLDDPNAATGGTLTGSGTVGKNLIGSGALGILVHASTIAGNVSESGGGPGLICGPDPVFGFGPYSDFEDNTIGKNLIISGLQTCWLGALRNTVNGNFNATGNTTADPDGNELISNTINGNMNCSSNTPAVQFGDSAGVSNVVGRNATGQCGFNVLAPNPEPGGPLTPISVKG